MMTHDDLLSQLTKRLGWAEPNMKKVLDAFIDTVRQELIAGNRVDISDFGLFQPRKQSEYILIDSETEERYLMPPSVEVVFEPAIEEAADVADVPDFSSSSSPSNPSNPSNPSVIRNAICFSPDESLEKEVNSSFAFFEPTLVNEGVQFPGIEEVYADEPKDEKGETDGEEIVATGRIDAPADAALDAAAEGVIQSADSVDSVELVKPVKPVEPAGPAELVEFVEPTEPSEPTEPTEPTEPSEPPELSKPAVPSEPPETLRKEKSMPAPNIRHVTGRKQKKKVSVWMPVLGGVAIALAVLFFFKAAGIGKTWMVNSGDQVQASQINEIDPKDQVSLLQADSISHPKPTAPPHESTEEKIILEEGETLRLLALDLFGSREFWVYIYLENKDKIQNPNRVQIGTELVVPDRAAYSIDATNPESVAQAKSLGNEMLNQ